MALTNAKEGIYSIKYASITQIKVPGSVIPAAIHKSTAPKRWDIPFTFSALKYRSASKPTNTGASNPAQLWVAYALPIILFKLSSPSNTCKR